jgi:hypothetical protein
MLMVFCLGVWVYQLIFVPPPLVVLAAGMPVDETGSAKANGREPKTGLGRVLNFKLGCLDDVHVVIYADARPHLQLKIRPRFVHG